MNVERPVRPELVIGLVGALGTDIEGIQTAIEAALRCVAYDSRAVRLSGEIRQLVDSLGLKLGELEPSESPIENLMNLGDAFRYEVNDAGAAARLAVALISSERIQEFDGEEGDAPEERYAVATIVRQLKHPAEVEVFRTIYGPRFLLIGSWAPRSERLSAIKLRLQAEVPNKPAAWYESQATKLIERDEKDGSRADGQRVRDTYQLADAYVCVRQGFDYKRSVERIVQTYFGAPFSTPTRDELAMFYAFGARLRSSAGGRQVGAVVVDGDGEVLVAGTNDVPRAHGGQYWEGDEPDHRDFTSGYDFNDKEKSQLVSDLMGRLKDAGGWLSEERAASEPADLAREALDKSGPISSSRIADLLEFGRILHAEMAVICTAARRGTPIGGTTLYTTTYPCHECARLIIGSGIARVVYVDPYPKSMVSSMYADQTTDDPQRRDRVVFEAFSGFSPRLFDAMFAMQGRERESHSGKYVRWDASTSKPRTLSERAPGSTFISAEDLLISELSWLD
ncbi:deaminase [Demequina aurantiaca]|uniref:deaminase n=1 Tax=Demequina aurantiaca TaxID=676200 RepID=UPI003D34E85C